jgi:hypothetical protein
MSRRLRQPSAPVHAIGDFLDSIDFDSDAARTQEDSLAKTVRMGDAATDTATATPNVQRHRAGEADWILNAAVSGLSPQRPKPHQSALGFGGGDAGGLTLAAGFHMVPAEDVMAAVSRQPRVDPRSTGSRSSSRSTQLDGATSRAFQRDEPTSAVTPAPRLGASMRPSQLGGHRHGVSGGDGGSGGGGGGGVGGDGFLDRIASEVDALQAQYHDGLTDLRHRELGLLQKLQQLHTGVQQQASYRDASACQVLN